MLAPFLFAKLIKLHDFSMEFGTTFSRGRTAVVGTSLQKKKKKELLFLVAQGGIILFTDKQQRHKAD